MTCCYCSCSMQQEMFRTAAVLNAKTRLAPVPFASASSAYTTHLCTT